MKKEKNGKEIDESEIKTVTVQKKGKAVVDSYCGVASKVHVIEQGGCVYDAMLNQTDISYGQRGHNKFYVVQALQEDNGKNCYVWTRWGRVGVKGQSKLEPTNSVSSAIAGFEKKFKEKTKNEWSNRANFKHVKGKYDLIEMDHGNDDDADDDNEKSDEDVEDVINNKLEEKRQSRATMPGSKLNIRVQELIKLIFDIKMFESTLVSYDIDVKKMPLGKISKSQIKKGYEVLEEIEQVLKGNNRKKQLEDLCSRFYTVIPHNFGMRLPPVIKDLEALQQKMDLLEVIGDIEVAQRLLEEEKKNKNEIEHPIDAKYKLLNNDVTAVEKSTKEYERIENYLNNTLESYKLELLDVFKVNRAGEIENFKEYDEIKERKLLWHGSKVAVFASILTNGLKIMPHSGGRVGRGLYFADIVAKSASYCGIHNKIGLILLNEVALGKQHIIKQDDSSLVKAPKGFDSVLAQGFKQVKGDSYLEYVFFL